MKRELVENIIKVRMKVNKIQTLLCRNEMKQCSKFTKNQSITVHNHEKSKSYSSNTTSNVAKNVSNGRSFSVAAPHAWNQLPADIRQFSTISTFKRHLKTHLFNVAFYD